MNIREKEEVNLSKGEKILSSAPLGKTFTRYVLPSVAGLVFYGLQVIIDGLIVGNYIGADALAGVNIIIPCYTMVTVIGIMIGIGSQTIISIAFGEKNYKKAQDAITTGFIAIAVFSIIMSLILTLNAETIAKLLGAESRLLPYSVSYIHGIMPFMSLIAIMFYSDYMLKAMGHPRFAMAIISSAVILNIVLDFFFVVCCNMGTFGAGLSTGISFTLGAVAASFITFNSKNIISVVKGRFRLKMLWEMMYNGSSEGVTELSIGISMIIINLTLMKYAGPDGIAAFTAINYAYYFGTTIFLGVSDGIIPILSYNHGSRNKKRLFGIWRMAALTNVILGVSLFLVLQVFGRPVISLFFRGEANDVINMAVFGGSIYAFAFLFAGFNILASSFFTSLAEAKVSIIVSSLRGWFFVLLFLLILPRFIGVNGVWLSIPLAEALTFFASVFLMKKAFKKYSLKYR